MQAYTIEQVAKMPHVGRDKIYLIRTGQLQSTKIGKSRRITEEHLAAFVASLEDEIDRLLGTAWDNELEPFRRASDGAPVRWLNATG